MAVDNKTFQSMADLTLFLKYRSGDQLMLSDIPKIIPLRWPWFRDNWEFFKPTLIDKISTYSEPDYLQSQIDLFSDFIDVQRTSKANVNPFSDQSVFFKFYGLFDNVEVDSVDLSNQEVALVNAALDRITQFTKSDFLKIKKDVSAARDTIADEIGLSDPDYNRVFNRSSVPKQVDAQIEDLARIQLINDQLVAVDFILANISSLDTSFVDPFALARVNANNPDFNIDAYKSGTLVRLNYGEDLQLLAKRYLGDADKWIDIAIANGLKPPYIDEVGEALFLISNGAGNELNLDNTNLVGELNLDKLFINQVVILQSDTQRSPDQRHIRNITQIPVSGELVIELSGDPDLSKYKLNENANMRVFKPNTINSTFFILIPSLQPLPDDRPSEVPYFLATATDAEKRAKVDVALNDNGDILLNSTGDVQLSYGLANAIQAIKLKIVTELGTLRRHPEFGLINVIGSPNQNIQAIKNVLTNAIDEQIRLDPRFERLETIDVRYSISNSGSKSATAFVIRMQVRLAGSSTVVPISFTVTA